MSQESNSAGRHPLRDKSLQGTSHLSLVPTFAAETRLEKRRFSAGDPVYGKAIDDYCRSRRLGPGRRVELLLQVCDTLASAHHDGVCHGSLQPNAMIVVESAGGVWVRMLGLGVADTSANHQPTSPRHRIVTGLEFRSPEQVIADSGQATAAGDVYALGALLYLLLVDCLPHDASTLEQAREMGMLSWTYDGGPLSLVGRVSLLGTRAQQVAHERRLDPSGLMDSVSGELSEVVGRALRPDPAERYADAGELACALRKAQGSSR